MTATPDDLSADAPITATPDDLPAGASMRPALGIWSRISTKLYMGIGGAVVMTLAASLVGWFSFNRVGDVQRRVNEAACPNWPPHSE